MVPHLVCSTMTLCSSSCLVLDSGISLPGSAAGALGLSLIVWSQMREGGNSCDVSSEKTLEYCWYAFGMFGSSGVSFASMMILPM